MAKVRGKRPERFQTQWRDASLDQLIPKDHRVGAVWAHVDSLDLKPLYEKIEAVEPRDTKTGAPDAAQGECDREIVDRHARGEDLVPTSAGAIFT